MKPRKYRNRPVEIDGISFDSAKEGRRYGELRLLERAGEIEKLGIHPEYRLAAHTPDGQGDHSRKFTPDFEYREVATQQWVVEDVKSSPTKTEAYGLRKWLFKANNPDIEFREV